MRWTVALLALVGCSSIFGLDGVKNDDTDGDRVPDAIDNCPDIANPDQSDVDKNGVGDACQLCGATDPTDSDGDGIPDQCDGCDNRLPDNNHDGVPDACENAAPPHDEDGDGIPDLHDNCPSVANPDQADNNESGAIVDGVGDACDDSIALDRQLFDGFVEPNQLWVFDGTGWELQNDHAVVVQNTAATYRYAGTAHGTFRISSHVTLAASGQATLVAIDGAGPGKQVKVLCSLVMAGQTSNVSIIQVVNGIMSPPSSVAYTGSGSELMTLTATSATTTVTFTCAAGAHGPPPLAVATTSPVFTTGIGASTVATLPTSSTGPVAFDYFDVVTSAP